MLFLFPLLLAACAQQSVRELPARPARDAVASYVVEGRVVVKRGGDSRQASIRWQHDAARDEIELSGPLGQKAARLSRDAGGARLETSSREVVTAPDWSSLAERVLGVALPLDDIARWVTGGVVARGIVEKDATGRPARATESGWRIDYLAYESDAPDALPALIELRRGDIEVRLKIDTWQLD